VACRAWNPLGTGDLVTRPMASNREAVWFLVWFLIACLICWAVVIAAVWAAIQFLLLMGSFIVPATN
jgi:hypothetical protein